MIYKKISDFYDYFLKVNLKDAQRFDWFTGYFGRDVLSFLENDIINLINNNGKLRIITGNLSDVRDIQEIILALNEKETFSRPFKKKEKMAINLYWLVKFGYLEIRVIKKLERIGIHHSKGGIIHRLNGTVCAFAGSANATRAAYIKNEEVQVTFEGRTKESKLEVEQICDIFLDLWQNDDSNNVIFKNSDDFLELLEKSEKIPKNFYIGGGEFDMASVSFDSKNGYYRIESSISIDFMSIKPNLYFHAHQVNMFKSGDTSKIIYAKSIFKLPNLIKALMGQGIFVFVPEHIRDSINSNIWAHQENSRLLQYIKNPKTSVRDEKVYIDSKSREVLGSNLTNILESKNNIVQKELERHKKRNWTLKDHQVKRIVMALISGGSYMDFSVPGSGKTLCTLMIYWILKNSNVVDSILILGPLSSHEVWVYEWEKFSGRKPSWVNLRDSKDPLRWIGVDIIVSHYASALKKSSELKKLCGEFLQKRIMLVVDEAHYIKSLKGAWGINMLSISKFVNHRIILTGTPIPKDSNDFLNYSEMTRGGTFRDRLQSLIEDDEEVRKELEYCYYRITKKDLKLPNSNYVSLSAESTKDQRELRKIIVNDKDMIPFVKVLRLLQLSYNPGLLSSKLDINPTLFDEDLVEEQDPELNKKLSIVNEKVNLNSISDSCPPIVKLSLVTIQNLVKKGEKVVVWTLFKNTAKMICKKLNEEYKISAQVYTGDSNSEQRLATLEFFKKGRLQVVCATYATLSHSVSLHEVCKSAVYLERYFNYALWDQSRNRIHRLGSTEAVTHYTCNTTYPNTRSIDERIEENLLKKEKRVEDILEGASVYTDISEKENSEAETILEEK